MPEMIVDKQIENIIKTLNALPEQVDQATIWALNRTADWVKSHLSQEVSEAMRIKLKTIRDRIAIQRANRRNLNATLSCNFKSVLVQDLPGVRQTLPGVVAGGVLYPHAFIAALRKGGKPGVYRRVGKSRLPVKRVTIPIFQEATKALEILLGEEGRKFFEKRFLHEITRITGAVA